MDIKELLIKYDKPLNGERYSKDYRKQLKQKRAIKHRHLVAGELIREVPFFVPKSQEKIVRYYIDTVKNFKKLHKRASNETIILAFIFLQHTLDNPKINIEDYTICKKYNLNNDTFRLIVIRLHNEILNSLPVTIHESKKDNYEYLEKSDY